MQFGQMLREQNGHLAPHRLWQWAQPPLSPPSCSVAGSEPCRCCDRNRDGPGLVVAQPWAWSVFEVRVSLPGPPPKHTWVFTPLQHQGEGRGGSPLCPPCVPPSRAAPCAGEQRNAGRKGCARAPRGWGAASGPRHPREATESPFLEATHPHRPGCPVSPCSSSPPPRGTPCHRRSLSLWHPPVPLLGWSDQEFSTALSPLLPSLCRI